MFHVCGVTTSEIVDQLKFKISLEILHFVLGTWMATLSTVQNDKDGWKAIDNDESTMAKTLVSRKDKMVKII